MIRILQFINGALRGIRGLWTEIAVREGKLSATGFLESARWRAAYLLTNWQGPPRRSVDEIKDEAAWDMRIRALRGSPQEYCNERSKTIEDVLGEIREFFDTAEQYGLGWMAKNFFGSPSVNRPKTGMRPDGTGGDADAAVPAGRQDGGNGDPASRDEDPAARDQDGGKGDLSRLVINRLVLQGLLDRGGNPASRDQDGGGDG